MRKIKQKSGISLIVLVITIIVIVILAVAVILTLANNNPISNANDAVKSNDIATLKEAATLAYAQWYTEKELGSVSEEPQAYVERVLREQNFTPEQIARVTVETDGKITIAEIGSNTASGWDGSIDTSWYNTTDTTFNLSTEAQLAGLAKLVNDGTDTFAGKTINLTSDLNMNNLEWTPIGSEGEKIYYVGKFDGNNHTISNLKITQERPSGSYSALFDNVTLQYSKTKEVYIKNVVLTNSYIKGEKVSSIVGKVNAEPPYFDSYIEGCKSINNYIEGSISAGGVANYLYGSSVKNSCNTSEVVCTYSGSLNPTSDYVNVKGAAGGIHVGGCDSATVYSCYNTGKISSTNGYAGGIIAIYNDWSIENSYNLGEINGVYAGGLSGYTKRPCFYNCYSTGIITGSTKGSLAGYLGLEDPTSNSFIVKNCYYLSGTEAFGVNTGTNTDYPEDTVMENVTAITEDNLKLESAVTFLNSNDYSEYVQDTNNINNGFPILSWQQ